MVDNPKESLILEKWETQEKKKRNISMTLIHGSQFNILSLKLYIIIIFVVRGIFQALYTFHICNFLIR